MKKTMTTFAIILTLCLATSVFAASPKIATPKTPMSIEQAMQDQLVRQYYSQSLDCVFEIVEREAFNHATTSAFYNTVLSKSLRDCGLYRRMENLRICELIVDPKRERPRGCTGREATEEYVKKFIDKTVVAIISNFDKYRDENGLPPRPSFDK